VAVSYAAVLFDLYGTLIDDRGEALAGAPALLRGLGAARWAIVTSCPAELALALLARSGLPVPPVLVTSDDVARNKPSPDGYLLAARRLAVEAAAALAIEDSAHGIEAALAAGMDVVAILRGRDPSFARRASFTAEWPARLVLRADAGAVVLELE